MGAMVWPRSAWPETLVLAVFNLRSPYAALLAQDQSLKKIGSLLPEASGQQENHFPHRFRQGVQAQTSRSDSRFCCPPEEESQAEGQMGVDEAFSR